MMLRSFSLLVVTLALSGAAHAQDLESRAKTLLAGKCLACHNATAKTAGLSLVTREAALQGGQSGAALAPGDAAKSLLYAKVAEAKMPPGNPLPGADRDLLRQWIEAGAPWRGALAPAERKRAGKDWWSLQPLREAQPPAAGGALASWARTPIDRFLAAAMAAQGLSGSPEADRRTLIRRATYDLTGLPPEPDEVEAFVTDVRPDAYERLIDRLLASAAYGERWGRHWLDVARFGESHAYEQNHLRDTAWRYRDYVIRSFNQDKPFDRMVLESLAGDLVAKDDPLNEAGTGFLVAGPHDTVVIQNKDGQLQQRADDLDDMINATASAFLGLTVNCARCHDHKFDPVPQADYYRLQAVFAGVKHGERVIATSEERRRYEEAVAPIRKGLEAAEARLKALREGAAGRLKHQRPQILARYRPAVDSQSTEERFKPERARFVRLHITGTSNGGAPGLDELEVWTPGAEGRNAALASAGAKITASSTRKQEVGENIYSEQFLIDGNFDKRWFGEERNRAVLTVELPGEMAVARVLWSRDRLGGFQGKFTGTVVESYTVEVSIDGRNWKQVASSAGRLPYSERAQEEVLLKEVFKAGERGEWESLAASKAGLEAELARTPKLPVAYAGRFEQPAEATRLLKRGSVTDSGDVVAPASLSALEGVLPGFSLDANAPESERRLALARWITDARNPLTPRVIANRIWHYHFGRGIVGTPSDFGFNGEKPVHPELLDYLARRLLEMGWGLKPLHKEIMMSAAYRQSSRFDEAKSKVDSEARLLWRFPPRRLDAEQVRDAALAVSGKLNRKIGGPGFRLYRYTVDNVATYYPLEQFGEETYRRSVYHQAPRSVRVDLLGQYDCPDSSLPEPKRVVTTTPLQALVLLNNQFLLDQAKFFAERLTREAGRDAGKQAERAFWLAYGRSPSASELAAAVALIGKHGLASFCRAVLNANEFVYVM